MNTLTLHPKQETIGNHQESKYNNDTKTMRSLPATKKHLFTHATDKIYQKLDASAIHDHRCACLLHFCEHSDVGTH